MKLTFIRAALAATILTLTVAVGIVSAHTGSISATQACGTGNTVTAQLDQNVAASATWVVKAYGNVVASGNGPGPANLGPYNVGSAAGTATLRITFNEEVNTYSVALKAVAPCPTPTPTPTPTPSHTPRPTPSLPNITPPPTSTQADASKDGTGSGGLLVLIAVISLVLIALVLTRRPGQSDRDW